MLKEKSDLWVINPMKIGVEPDQQPVSLDSDTAILQPVADSAQAMKIPEPGSIVGLTVLAGIAIAAGQKQT